MMLLHLKALLVTWRQSLLHVAHAAKSAMERLANASLQFQLVAMIASTLTRLPAFPDRLPSTQEPRAQMRSSSNTHKSQEGKSSMVNSTSKPFFQERCTWLSFPCIFCRTVWARSREFDTLLNRVPLVAPDTSAWQKEKNTTGFLEIAFSEEDDHAEWL